MSNEELTEAVRKWVYFDNLGEEFYRQAQTAREKKAQYEEKIISLLNSRGMADTSIKVSGATLQRATRREYEDLTWKYLERELAAAPKTAPPQTIIEHLKNKRAVRNVDYIKKTVTNPQNALKPK